MPFFAGLLTFVVRLLMFLGLIDTNANRATLEPEKSRLVAIGLLGS